MNQTQTTQSTGAMFIASPPPLHDYRSLMLMTVNRDIANGTLTQAYIQQANREKRKRGFPF